MLEVFERETGTVNIRRLEEDDVERWTHQVIGLPGLEIVVSTLTIFGEYKYKVRLSHCHWRFVCVLKLCGRADGR